MGFACSIHASAALVCLLFLPGNPRAQAISAMLPTLRKCSDGRPASRGPSELLECGVQCVQCAGTSQRVVQPVSCDWQRPAWGSFSWRGCGLANLRTCAAPEAFHIWLYREYHPFRFRPWNANDQGCPAARAAVAPQLSIPPILSLLRRVPILGCLRSLGRDSK
jgi:hypothetical protein